MTPLNGPRVEGGMGAAHPSVATHDAAGLASDVELAAQVAAFAASQATQDAAIASLTSAVSALQQGIPPTSSPQIITYPTSTASILNPGRGMMAQYVIPDHGATLLSFESELDTRLASDNVRTVRVVYNLNAYRGTDTIATAFTDIIAADLAWAQTYGIKLIIRFAYDYSGSATNDPAFSRVSTHIDQLATPLNAAPGAILGYEMGIIGPYGENGDSSNFGAYWWPESNWSSRDEVIQKMIDTVTSKPIAVRYPRHIRYYYDRVSVPARLGFHHDAMLAELDEWGTWDESNSLHTPVVDDSRSWVEGTFLSTNRLVGGEQENGAWTDAEVRTKAVDFATYHWTYLNAFYNTTNIDALKGGNHPTHSPTITWWQYLDRYLGYRFQMVEGRFPIAAVPTESYSFELDIKNLGFSATIDSYVAKVKVGAAAEVTATMTTTADVAKPTTGWGGYQSPSTTYTTHTVKFTFTVPALAAGQHALVLSLVDPVAGLQADPNFRIQFANSGTWDSTNGRNALLVEVTVA